MARDYSSGFVCLHRKMKDWEWYTDRNTLAVFIHIILSVNHKEGDFRGVHIDKGSFITSYQHLADELKMSKHQVRTAIEHLEMAQCVTHKTAQRMNIITLVNWEKYQCQQKEDGTISGTVDGFEMAPNEQCNKYKQYIESKTSTKKNKKIPPSEEEVKAFCKEKGYVNVDVDSFFGFYGSNGWKVGKNPMVSWEAAVRNWNSRNKKTQKSEPVHEVHYRELE